MKRSSFDNLRCPALSGEHDVVCGGSLFLEENKPLRHSDTSDDIIEGFIRCETCGAFYPIIAGVAIVIPKPFRYVRDFFSFLKGLLSGIEAMGKEFAVELHRHLLLDLEKKDEKLFPRAVPFNEKTTLPMHKWLGTYILSHFLDPVPSGHAYIDELLTVTKQHGPLSLLPSMGERYINDRVDFAVDLGCSVGGLTVRCSGFAESILGIDLSFEKILSARRIVIGEPSKAEPLRLYREGASFESIPIDIPHTDNADFIVGSGTVVPVKSKNVGLVTSCNLVDVISEPLKLLAEKRRILKRGGILLMATPYLDHAPAVLNHLEAGTGAPKETVMKNLEGFDVLEEFDNVPWILRASNRHYDLYLDHCLAAVLT